MTSRFFSFSLAKFWLRLETAAPRHRDDVIVIIADTIMLHVDFLLFQRSATITAFHVLFLSKSYLCLFIILLS